MTDTSHNRKITRFRFSSGYPAGSSYPRRNPDPSSRPGLSELGMTTACDGMAAGVAILGASGYAVSRNQTCSEMLGSTTSGLFWANGFLRARRRPDMRALEETLMSALYWKKLGALRIQDLDSDHATEILMSGIASGAEGEPQAMAIMRRPANIAPKAGLLSQLYDLTPAEAALAAELVTGSGLERACKARGITINTGKGYLKRIFQKTGTRRQSELVAVILGGVAAFGEAGVMRQALESTA